MKHAALFRSALILLSLQFGLTTSAVAEGGKEQSKTRIAIMPLTGLNVEEYLPKVLDEFLTVEVGKFPDYEVLSTGEIKTMLGLEEMKQAIGCDDVACLVEIGGALNVAYIVSGKVSRLGSKLNLSLTLSDIQKAKVLARHIETVDDEENLLADAMARAVRKLFGKLGSMAPKVANGVGDGTGKPIRFVTSNVQSKTGGQDDWPQGALYISSEPASLTALIDGQELGQTPLVIDEIAAGPHELKLRKGLSEYSGSINVKANSKKYFRATIKDYLYEKVLGTSLTVVSLPLFAAGLWISYDNENINSQAVSLGSPDGLAVYAGVGGILLGIAAASTGVPMMMSAFGDEEMVVEEVEP